MGALCSSTKVAKTNGVANSTCADGAYANGTYANGASAKIAAATAVMPIVVVGAGLTDAPRFLGDPCFDWGVVAKMQTGYFTKYMDSKEWHLYYAHEAGTHQCLFVDSSGSAAYHFWRHN